MASGNAGEIAARNLYCTNFNDVCLWIKCTWESISIEVIVESFKKCKIFNDLDSDLKVFNDGIINDSDNEVDDKINNNDKINDANEINDDNEINDNKINGDDDIN